MAELYFEGLIVWISYIEENENVVLAMLESDSTEAN